jgi:hypothetical protein
MENKDLKKVLISSNNEIIVWLEDIISRGKEPQMAISGPGKGSDPVSDQSQAIPPLIRRGCLPRFFYMGSDPKTESTPPIPPLGFSDLRALQVILQNLQESLNKV